MKAVFVRLLPFFVLSILVGFFLSACERDLLEPELAVDSHIRSASAYRIAGDESAICERKDLRYVYDSIGFDLDELLEFSIDSLPRFTRSYPGDSLVGTLYAETYFGPAEITRGAFKVHRNAHDEIEYLQGYGNAQIPMAGPLNDILFLADQFGAVTKYAPGQVFLAEREHVPFRKDGCYFRYTLDPLSFLDKGDPFGLAKIKNTLFSFNELYVDPYGPSFYYDGSMFSYPYQAVFEALEEDESPKQNPSPSKPNDPDNREKEPKKRKAYKSKSKPKSSWGDVTVGVSLNNSFRFRHGTFSEEMESIVSGGTNFEDFDGGLYLSGTLPLVKYPLEIDGEMMAAAEPDIVELFDKGFDQAPQYRQGVNGTLFFGHKLLNLLPLDLRIELGNATARIEVSPEQQYLRMGGEYEMDPKELFNRILGEKMLRNFPSFGPSGQMYLNIGNELSDWEFYIMNRYQLKIPNVDTSDLKKQYFHFTPQKTYIGSEMNLPAGLGSTLLYGELNDDGSFKLTGKIQSEIPFGPGGSLRSKLEVTASNQGLFIQGLLWLPGDQTGIEVTGTITKDAVILEGKGGVRLKLGNTEVFDFDAEVIAAVGKGVSIKGTLGLPMGAASVSGGLNQDGLFLDGGLKGVKLAGGTSGDFTIRATTKSGVKVNGSLCSPQLGKLNNMVGSVSEKGYNFSAPYNIRKYYPVAGLKGTVHSSGTFTVNERGVFINGSSKYCYPTRVLKKWKWVTVTKCIGAGTKIEGSKVCIGLKILGKHRWVCFNYGSC